MSQVLVKNIQTYLKKRGLSIFRAEKMAGLPKDSIRNILNGKSTNPGHRILAGIGEFCKCTINDLFEEQNFENINAASLQPDLVKTKDFARSAVFMSEYLTSKNLHLLPKRAMFSILEDIWEHAHANGEDQPADLMIGWRIERSIKKIHQEMEKKQIQNRNISNVLEIANKVPQTDTES